jgi:DNA-directed DNA polymerase III PolC
MFVHLNAHSHYSRMEGTASQQALLNRVGEAGQDALALTETNGLWGFIRFVQYAKERQIKPIAGVLLRNQKRDEALLLAENQRGYENISRIVSAIYVQSDAPLGEILAPRQEGIFVLAHQWNILNELSTLIPASRLFVELRPGLTEMQAREMARTFQLEMVATANLYFLQPDDYRTHRILRAIDKNTTLSGLDAAEIQDRRSYFRDEAAMIDLFPNSLEAINNSRYLAERCKTDWTYLNTIFPEMSLKATARANKRLKELVQEGALKRYVKITAEIQQRIDYELKLIIEKGFAPYFLVVWDIVKQTKATIGRGSGAASVVSYCLYITQVDPIRYNLNFHRFIHPERVDMPDIDVDFPWDERDDILDYIFKKYGNERTAMVCSQVMLQPRSAIREVAKVYGLSNEEINAITRRIGWSRSHRDLTAWVSSDPRFRNLNLDETLLEILQESEKIIGAFRYPSVHPGGVVIVPDEIQKYVPVLKAPKGVQIAQWEKDQIEDSGLLKIDILGNRSLAVVRDTLKQLGNYRNQFMDYHQIQPMGDAKTEALMKAGRTMGVFYIESPATRQLLQKAGKVDFEHVVIYSSIIRPAANRFINLMLDRIHGTPWELPHSDLQCLAESYGIMVYEEQVSMTAREIAGFGYAESDYLRKVISRPALVHLVPRWKKKFTAGALKRGYSAELAETLWKMIESFSGYSFCKPHSASFAMLSFSCAYLKAHFPAEFLSSVITNQGGFYSAYAYLSEARRFGIEILPPDLNLSEIHYKGRRNKLRIGFMAIQKLQQKAIETVISARNEKPFASLDDFFQRIDLEWNDAMAFTKAGALNALSPELNYRELAWRVARRYLGKATLTSSQHQWQGKALTAEEKDRLETESFGFPISRHPLAAFENELKGQRILARELPAHIGKKVRLAGVLITRKVSATRQDEPMEFVTFEDETEIFECVMFPQVYEKYSDLLLWEKLFLIEGKVEQAWGVISITIDKLQSLNRRFAPEKEAPELKSIGGVG